MHFKTVKHTVASETVFAKRAMNSMVWLVWMAHCARVSRAKPEIKREGGLGRRLGEPLPEKILEKNSNLK